MTRRCIVPADGLRRHPIAAWMCTLAVVALAPRLAFGLPNAMTEGAASDATAVPRTPPPSVTTPPKTNPAVGRALDDRAASNPSIGVLAVRLELVSPEGCGTLAQFVERLHARMAGVRWTDSGAERAVQARIELTADDTVRATMTLLQPNGRTAERVIAANSCAEAIEALALITAVTLEPLVVELESNNAASATKPSQVPTPKPAIEPARAARDHSFDNRPASNATSASDATTFGFGAAYAMFRGPSPRLLHGFEFSARAMRRHWSKLSPSVRLGLAYAVEREYAAEGGVADFAFASSTLDLCPGQVLWQSVEVRGCALLLGGVVAAQGRATLAPERRRRPFFSLGATAEIVLLPHRSLAVPVRFFGSLPTSRDRYAFDPVAFYRVPAVAFGLTVGLEARFR